MMFNPMAMKKQLPLLTIVALLSMIGCAQKPSQMVIAPDVRISNSNAYSQLSAHVSVIDLRTHNHIIEINKENQAKHLVSNANDFAQSLAREFKQALTNSGLSLTGDQQQQFSLTINQATISVEQSLSRYKTNSTITLTAQLKNPQQTLTKTFKSKANSEGILTADIAVLERDFNQQLGKLIGQIVSDQEILQFMQQGA